MIDVAVAREAYNRHEVSIVGLVKSEHNFADGLTKPPPCSALDALLRTGIDNNPVQLWIIRSLPTTKSAAAVTTAPEATQETTTPTTH